MVTQIYLTAISNVSQSAALWYYRPTSLALSGIAGLSWFVFGLYQSTFLVRKGKNARKFPVPNPSFFLILFLHPCVTF